MTVAERDARQGISRPGSVVDSVYDIIYHRLMSLDIAPGARIPMMSLHVISAYRRRRFERL